MGHFVVKRWIKDLRAYLTGGRMGPALWLGWLGLWLVAGFLPATAQETAQAPEEMTMIQSNDEGDRAGWYFYDDADHARIREAASTDWGQAIVDSMKKAVTERRTHDLDVPTSPSGHYHKYFCPTHKCLLTFDWDKPRQHYCPQCKEYLTGAPYDDPWFRFVHVSNQAYLRDCMMLYIITGQAEYVDYIRAMLLDYAGKYRDFPIHGNDMEAGAKYGGRIFSQSLGESVWVCDIAPAYVEIRPLLTPEDCRIIEEGLFRPCVEVIYRNRAGGNWQVWHNAGIISCAVALGDEKFFEISVNDPDCGYGHMMEVGATSDGWWNEGSPGYHFYPLNAMVYTAEAARCRGVNLWDGRLNALFTGPVKDVYPDLSFPSHNDGWYGTSLISNASLYEIAALRLDEPMYDALLARCYSRVTRNNFRALVHGAAIEPDPSPLPLESTVYRELGVALLRDGQRTVVFKYGPYGGGHGHPDKLSLAIHDGKNEILPDMGTPGYGVPDYTRWYKNTISHSTVVVDQANQKPVTGKLVSFEPSVDGGGVESMCDTAYPGVEMRRRLSLADGELTDLFTCESSDEHIYDYVLILRQPLELGVDAETIEFKETWGYDRIANAHKVPMDGPRVFELEGVTLTLDPGPGDCELIQGEAPGIPINESMTVGKDAAFHDCYPLIVRVKGKSMSVKAIWNWSQ